MNASAKLDAMGDPLRKCRGQCSDARSDADRNGEDVVDEQGGCRDEAGHLAKIFARNDVGAAAARVRIDRLPV